MNPSPALFLLAAEPTSFGTVYQSILEGGLMMIPIGLCSILALGFFVERWMALAGRKLIPGRFANDLEEAMKQSPEKAFEYCEGVKAPVARMFGAGLRRWNRPLLEMEKAVEDAGAREVARLSAPLKPLLVVAAVSPLLGLLGTVIGMIKAFNTIALEKGIGKPELLAEGISEALVTTAAGLIVAIPAQLAYFYLKSRVDKFSRRAEVIYHEVVGRRVDLESKKAA